MSRGRAFTRYQRRRAIGRRVGIVRRIGECMEGWIRGVPGRLDKGKIHCSCWMCRTKSYDFLSHSDLMKEERDADRLREFGIFHSPAVRY